VLNKQRIFLGRSTSSHFNWAALHILPDGHPAAPELWRSAVHPASTTPTSSAAHNLTIVYPATSLLTTRWPCAYFAVRAFGNAQRCCVGRREYCVLRRVMLRGSDPSLMILTASSRWSGSGASPILACCCLCHSGATRKLLRVSGTASCVALVRWQAAAVCCLIIHCARPRSSATMAWRSGGSRRQETASRRIPRVDGRGRTSVRGGVGVR
jgi:hypothetical protein